MHVAIIMDGNGRWARSKGLPRWKGHVAGAESVRRVVRAAPECGVEVLTLYAFSSDNWKRPSTEVGRLFWLLRRYCRQETRELIESGVRVQAIGRRDRIPRSALRELEETERLTAHGDRLLLRLAIDYSSRYEICKAVAETARSRVGGEIDNIDTDHITRVLTHGVPDPDVIVRTAGERRLSDFLLWEASYSEFVFFNECWPDFTDDHLSQAVVEFNGRERRFGAVPGTALT